MNIVKKLFFIYIYCSLSMLFLSSCQTQDKIYLFSYFKDNGTDGLHLAYSKTGYEWHALKGDSSFLAPKVSSSKLMRDPCIIKGPDGIFRMVWTVSWTTKGVGYAFSKDLVNWSEQKLIPVMEHEDDVRNCWAPEITYDKKNKEYMIYWSSTIRGRYPLKNQMSEDEYNHRIYYVITKDFNAFTETKLLYDRGFNVIDATIHPLENKYVMFMKDETLYPSEKNIKIAYSDNLIGPYTNASKTITGNYWAEGPAAIKIKGKWIVYFDKYKEGKYGAVESNDLRSWIDISDKISFPNGTRHGSVFRISEKELNILLHLK
ncbi:glycoside hydrolase family 43 protein [uncultured Bacteroides sp.]|uniref:glycoside hydrolase family 43 protein n=1 Tax=uncultured Bacteroides sp. TaxID=162156 RepID=UPI002AAB426E|nr:glycoside hydrolase family 43 protein [uncultured Bacteroides sp.]